MLVTGASGLLGTRLTELAAASGVPVYSAYKNHLPLHGGPVLLDITDEDAVRKCVSSSKLDVVINTASLTDVDACEENPELAMRVNGEAVRFLVQSCRENETHLIQISTDYVFDGERGSYGEHDERNPINAYGRSKLLGERMVEESSESFLIARTSVVFGWGREHRPNFATWLKGKLSAGERANLAVDQYSSPTLNSNLAEMLLESANRRLTGVLHLAGATRVNRYEFALRFAREFGFDENLIQPVKSDLLSWKAKRPRDSSLNVSKAQQILNSKPLTIERALEQLSKEAKSQLAR